MRKILLPIASLSLVASCDPRVFDDLADTTWVHSGSKPGDLDSAGFAAGLIGGGGDSLHYFVAAEAPPSVTMVKFDSAGKRSTVPSQIRATLTGAEALSSPAVMAVDADSFDASNGNVAVGTFDGSEPTLFMIRGENGRATTQFNLIGNATPSAIAFGATDASAETDLLSLAGSTVNIIADYQGQSVPDAAVQCDLDAVGAGLAIADVDAAAGDEVLIATDGAILVVSGSALVAAAAAEEDCFATVAPIATIDAPANEASFGTGITTADFDGNGEPDLLVTAPAQLKAYVFLNWNTAAPSTGSVVEESGTTVEFAASFATGDFDGDGRDELVLSDPGVRSGGKARAGAVYLYPTDGSGALQSALVLHDAQPEADQRFGQSVTVTQAFGGDNLVVGADDEVFTYFRTPLSGDDDPRN